MGIASGNCLNTFIRREIKEIALLRTLHGVYSWKSSSFQKEEIEVADLNLDEILLLEMGIVLEMVLNLCKIHQEMTIEIFKLKVEVLKR
jgi:hypothetical protein